jgi:integrase
MARHLLTDAHVRAAKPRAMAYRLRDGDGLFLFVPPSGVSAWQFRYKIDGKSQTLTIGKAATFSLAEARVKANDARKLAADGKQLTTAKRVAKANTVAAEAATFGTVAESWIRKRRAKPWSDSHRDQVRASIDRHLAPLKALPVTEITARLVTPVLAKIDRRAPLMHDKVRRRLHRVLDHAVMQGALERNPLPAPEPERRNDRKHFPAVTALPELGAILRAARASDPAKGIQRAHALLVYTAQRVSEVVAASWSEFDLQAGTWSIPRVRMKRKDVERGPHEVPLPPGLLAALREWRAADDSLATMVCAAPRDPSRSVTPEGVEKYYRDALHLQGKHSPHSWRSAFSTVAREAGKDSDVVEAQLDHVVGNKVASAYDRSKRLHLRREIMRWYERQLIAARDGADVVKIVDRRRQP